MAPRVGPLSGAKRREPGRREAARSKHLAKTRRRGKSRDAFEAFRLREEREQVCRDARSEAETRRLE